ARTPNTSPAPATQAGSAANRNATNRERPAMIACPWTTADTSRADQAPPPPTGTNDPPRARIPDCAPPGWKAPGQLSRFNPPPLPADRPKAIVDDNLKYVVTEP